MAPNWAVFAVFNAILESGPMDSIVSALTTAMTTIKTDFFSVLTGILPIALAIIGAGLVVVLGIKMFKKLTNKAG